MVKQIKYITAFLKLVRLPNLVVIALTQYFLRWFVLIPLLEQDDFLPQLSELQYFFLVLSTVLIAAAGYIINDYFDRKADLINRPKEVVVGRVLSRRAAMFWHLILSALGVLLGAAVSYKVGQLKFSIVFVLMSGLLWFYSTTYKRQLLVGNLMVAFMVGMVPMIILLFEIPLLIERYQVMLMASSHHIDFLTAWILAYAVFAFMSNLIREIVKDIEDFEGDYAFGRNTVPIAWGIKVSKYILIGLILATVVPLALIVFLYLKEIVSTWFIGLTIILPFLILAYLILKAQNRRDYSRISLILKIVMLFGLIYCIIASYFVF